MNLSALSAAQLYSTASYQTGDLSGIIFSSRHLTGWDFSGQKLANASFYGATLINTIFANADIRGANFVLTTDAGGFTADQLYETASYQAGNLSGILLAHNDLTAWNFTGQNLSNADFQHAVLADTVFYQANLTQANMENATLTNSDLRHAQLHSINFKNAALANVDFSGAEIQGADFSSTTNSGLTSSQFYSTASYETGELLGIVLSSNDLTAWNFSGQNLTDAIVSNASLTNADFSQANLTRADLTGSTLVGADFTDAQILGVNFDLATSIGFTAAHLYSTSSYQQSDLGGVSLRENDLTSWNFESQNLIDANFDNATLAETDFTDANIRHANFSSTTASGFTALQLYSTASYQISDLRGVALNNNDLTNWNFKNQNLRDTFFIGAILTGADFTDANISGAALAGVTSYGFTAGQLYSTASYEEGNLSNIRLDFNDLTDWNFMGKNLRKAWFEVSILEGTNFTAANLTDARLNNLQGNSPILSGADIRNSSLNSFSPIAPNTPETHNTIFPDGVIHGLDILPGETMRLWDYDSETPLPITVEGMMQVDATGALRVVIEDDSWGSTMTFESGIDVLLDGTLELLVDPDETATLTNLIGTTFDLFDWTGVTPDGVFDEIATGDGLVWDTTDLYTTGDVTLVDVPGYLFGDFDDDGDADGIDFLAAQRNFGAATDATGSDGDTDDDGDVDWIDLKNWEDRFGEALVTPPGDFDSDTDIDALDFLAWQAGFGIDSLATLSDGDADRDGDVDTDDLTIWVNESLGELSASVTVTPEPSGVCLALIAVIAVVARRPEQVRAVPADAK